MDPKFIGPNSKNHDSFIVSYIYIYIYISLHDFMCWCHANKGVGEKWKLETKKVKRVFGLCF